MPVNVPMQRPEKVIRLIHLSLMIGVVSIAAAIVAARVAGGASPPNVPVSVGFILAGIGVVAIAISLAVMRPRVGQRSSNQSPGDFWDPARCAAVTVVWALLEGGGLAGVVGYFASAQWAPLALVPVSLLALFFTRPGAFE